MFRSVLPAGRMVCDVIGFASSHVVRWCWASHGIRKYLERRARVYRSFGEWVGSGKWTLRARA